MQEQSVVSVGRAYCEVQLPMGTVWWCICLPWTRRGLHSCTQYTVWVQNPRLSCLVGLTSDFHCIRVSNFFLLVADFFWWCSLYLETTTIFFVDLLLFLLTFISIIAVVLYIDQIASKRASFHQVSTSALGVDLGKHSASNLCHRTTITNHSLMCRLIFPHGFPSWC